MGDLSAKTCVPCQGGVAPLKGAEIDALLEQVSGWDVMDEHHLTKMYNFRGFVQALAFVNQVGAVAEEQGHHPDLHLSWGKVRVDIWTHKINGLTESDFILAAKIDELG